MKFENLVRPSVRQIKEYVPGKSIKEIATKYGLEPETIIKLGSNENVLGPSPKAVTAIQEHADGVNLYPASDADGLKQAISGYIGCSPDNIVVSGNGMDGIFDTILKLFISQGDETIISLPTFSYYEIATLANGGKPVFAKRKANFDIDTKSILDKVTDNTKIVFLCSPNNPTGNPVSEEQAREILESVNAIVFIDEAYVEFSENSLAGLVKEYDNLIVGRTFSKAFGLAGMRMGYAIAPEWICREYMKVMTPFSMDVLSCEAGIAAIDDKEHFTKTIKMVEKGRVRLTDGLSSLCKVYPTDANFILIDVSPKKASDVSELLLKQGIIVRDCTSFRDAGESLIRITVGTEEQNRKVIQALGSVL